MDDVGFGHAVLVRAEVVRVIAEPFGDGHRYRQKVADSSRFGTHSFEASLDAWPGKPIPATWTKTTKGWQIEPTPNGTALLRCRRMTFTVPVTGIVLGWSHLYEGSIQTDPSGNELVDRRKLTLYEIALPPIVRGKARITLAHPNDVAFIPGAD